MDTIVSKELKILSFAKKVHFNWLY